MIYGKDINIFCSCSSSSSSTTRDSAPSNNAQISRTTDQVLRNLFQARMEQDDGPLPIISHRCPMALTNERTRRVTPLATMSSAPSLILCRDNLGGALRRSKHATSTTEWNPSSLLRQLEHQFTMKTGSSASVVGTVSAPALSSARSAPFPLRSSFFTSSNNTINTIINNTRPTATATTEDATLDLERIRSFSAALTGNKNNNSTTSTTSTIPNHFNSNSNKRNRVRNQATRYRLVGQVLGQKGVQKVVALVQEIQLLQQSEHSISVDSTTSSTSSSISMSPRAVTDLLSNTVLMDAWTRTPLNDIKSLPWEEMIATAQKHVDAYKEWKAFTTN